MQETTRQRSAPFSDLPMAWKFLVFGLTMLLVVCSAGVAMYRIIFSAAQRASRESEQTAVSAAQQLMDLTVDTSVSIAKSIYTDEDIYEFLGKRYSSTSAYYEAYYLMQQDLVMHISDVSIINDCVIYTQNPTVLTGGKIYRFDETTLKPAWLTYFLDTERSSVLYLDPDKGRLYFVRQLDYHALTTGDSYLCMELNLSLLRSMASALAFDGDLYILSGSTLLYSSDDTVDEAAEVMITPDFEGVTTNYYTVDVGFYACAAKQSAAEQALAHPVALICTPVLLAAAILTGGLFLLGIRRRVRAAVQEFTESGTLQQRKRGENGADEIGRLLDICCGMSERLMQKDDKFRQSRDSLSRKNSDYDTLFATAMRLDAELTVRKRLPGLTEGITDEQIPLAQELTLLQHAAELMGMQYKSALGEDDIPAWTIPAYSLVLTAEDIARHYGGVLVQVKRENGSVRLLFEGAKTPRNPDVLHLLAIFEDDAVSEVYDFDRSSRFNPYLRLKSALGSRVDAELAQKQAFRMVIRISEQL